ncbi:BamA/TamA family outer membrane protein [Fibrobacter sp. UWS1]|uniref:BamA/TamA family outer membrane protein n=1 Tax=Fibrobacter sp. UWS1 TaxID=1896220 RepID=UPI000BC3B07C|nr:BamA/TamA family outer membrane protein [Fibrobacter sp. UWS1]PBC68458.1 outer membrane protein assembly factor BamA [Fibrobacter sp. UWS1]
MMLQKLFLALVFLTGMVLAKEIPADSSVQNPPKNAWKVSFIGNELYADEQLAVELDIPEEFGIVDTIRQDFLMQVARTNLELLYFSAGYFSFTTKLEVLRNQTDEQDSVPYTLYRFLIQEGERYTFNEIKIDRDSIADSVALKGLKFQTGAHYDPSVVADNVLQIQVLYRENGYLHVRADYLEFLDTLHHQVNVEIYVEPGTKVRMGDFTSSTQKPARIANLNTTDRQGLSDTAWLNRLWRIPKGEVINGKTYTSFRNKLLSTQIFSQIHLEDAPRSDSLSDIRFSAVERIPGEARYSVFFEEVYGFGASATVKHKNLGGHFHEGSASILVAQNKQELTLGYANPLLFGTRFSFIPTAIRFDDHISFNHEKTSPPAYPDSLEERYEIINRGDLTFGLARSIRFRATLDTRFVQKNDLRLFKIKGETALSFDFTDDYFNPTKGVRALPKLGMGANFTGNIRDPKMEGNPYTYGEITGIGYLPLFGPFLSAFSVSYGKFFDKAMEDDARIFYQGGSRTVRGYRFRSIYPSYTSIDEEGEEIINTGLTPQYVRANAELRINSPFEWSKNWQLVEFYDWAYVSDKESGVYKGRSQAAFGTGIRYKWQFLTIRLDYTFKKDFNDWNPESFAFQRINFDLSQAF